LKEVLERFDITNSLLLGIASDNASSNCLIPWERQSTLETFRMERPASRNSIPRMNHVIQLVIGAFMSSLGVKGHTKSWEAHECQQHFGEHKSTELGKSHRLRKEGNGRSYMVSTRMPGGAKIIVMVCILRTFKRTETNLSIAANDCGIDYLTPGL
jgi:hypothetical protein